jgi:hypothetical protein
MARLQRGTLPASSRRGWVSFGQDRRCRGWGSNQAPPEWEYRMLTLSQLTKKHKLDLNPTSETVSRSPTQELANIPLKPEAYYHVLNIPPVVPTLSQTNLAQTTYSLTSCTHTPSKCGSFGSVGFIVLQPVHSPNKCGSLCSVGSSVLQSAHGLRRE